MRQSFWIQNRLWYDYFDSDWVVVWPVCRAIEMNISWGSIVRSEKQEDLMKLSEDLMKSSREVFDKVVLALDGLVISTRQPYLSEVDNILYLQERSLRNSCFSRM